MTDIVWSKDSFVHPAFLAQSMHMNAKGFKPAYIDYCVRFTGIANMIPNVGLKIIAELAELKREVKWVENSDGDFIVSFPVIGEDE